MAASAENMDEDTSVRQRFTDILRACCGITLDLWTEVTYKALDTFIKDTSITAMFVYVGANQELKVVSSMPSEVPPLLAYFFRDRGTVITTETIEEVVDFGTLRGDINKFLLQHMKSVHAPLVFHGTDWPKNLKDSYTTFMHGFMATLTDEVHKEEGRTVLYIPMEALQSTPKEACKDIKLVQRMETVVTFWTDQLKRVLNESGITKRSVSRDLLQEIDFWRSHSDKLLHVSQQLQKPEVKHIQDILQLARSQFLPRFSELSNQIQTFCEQAKSNLQVLSHLKEPCEELASLPPSEVSPKLQHIVHIIRLIWSESPHYNSVDRITGLFYKLSAEIIRICVKSIPLERIFKGYVVSSKRSLADCIQCCSDWKEIYLETSQIHQRFSPKPWDLDSTRIFVLMDLYVHRFKELVEVCDCQDQFARWQDGEQRPLPFFSGCEGPKFTRNLWDLERQFHQGLEKLRSVGEGALDVEDTVWENEFCRFKALIKDLEVTAQEIIMSVFQPVNLVDEGVRLLHIFSPMARREAMRPTTERTCEHVYSILNRELTLVNKMLIQDPPSPPYHMSQVIVRARWISGLKQRLQGLQRPMEALQKASFLPESATRKEVFAAHSQTVQMLEEMLRQLFSDWAQGLDAQIFTRLEQNLMLRHKEHSARLVRNFDTELWELFTEAHHWELLKFQIPQSVLDRSQHREDYMTLRDQVQLLTRNYNRIIEMLSSDELELFCDQINFLDEKIEPGLSTHTWLSKEASSVFVQDCLAHVDKVCTTVEKYHLSS